MSIVLEARGLSRDYKVRRGMFSPVATVKALADVSFDLQSGKTLAVVGESHNGGGGAGTFGVFDHLRRGAIHDGDAGIGGAEVDTDDFAHVLQVP